MPKLSQKGIEMPASPIRKLTPFADKAKAEGKTVYHLNIGQPDIETPIEMIEAIKNIEFKVWAYTASEGNLSYRQKLASYYQKLQYDIQPEDIIVTNGGSEALIMSIITCLNDGDEVIVPEPFYANYSSFARMGNVVVKPIVSSIETNFALPPIEAFEKLITPKTKAILICSPNNPTGYLYSRAEMESLKHLVLKHDLFLISDEAYREFCYEGNKFISPLHLDGLDENVILIDTISKRYSACGARLGCLISKNKEVIDASLKFAQSRLCPPAVAQIAAEAGLDTPQSYFEDVKKEYNARRNILVETLNKIPGVICPSPKGAFYVIAKLPIDDSEKFCEWMLDKFSYENQTVMMAPASGFYFTPDKGKNEVRLAYVINQNDIKKAMICLSEGIKTYQKTIMGLNA